MAEKYGAMHVAKIRRRHEDREYVSHLVRRSIREGTRVRHETIANISRLPAEAIEALTLALKGARLLLAGEAFRIKRSLPHGDVEAVLAAAGRLGLARLLDREPSRERDLGIAMIVSRVLSPGSKLATVRSLSQSTLGAEVGVVGCDQDDLYGAMDWLLDRQPGIEQRLARRHLKDRELALYDVSSSYFEGRECPLAKLGYSRDGKRGTLQVIYGLTCDADGRPVAIEAFDGSLHDDKTLPDQVTKLKQRFGLSRVIVVCDRGFATKANVELLSASEGVGWITALKAPQVQKLVKQGVLQLSLFDEQNICEIACEQLYPAERLVVCRNPLVAAERARKRNALLAGTEHELEQIAQRVSNGTLTGEAQIGLAVGAVWNRYKVKKHFALQITDDSFSYSRKAEQIAAEAALDGIYALRAGHISPDELAAAGIVRAYKQLKEAEKGFGTIKGPLEVRPIHHHLEDRVRAHLLICMLAHYLIWHLRTAWTELLYHDPTPASNVDPVAKATRSLAATRKAHTHRTTTTTPATPSQACSQSSPPAPATPSNPPTAKRPSISSPNPPSYKPTHSRSSTSTYPSSRSHEPDTPADPENPKDSTESSIKPPGNFGLELRRQGAVEDGPLNLEGRSAWMAVFSERMLPEVMKPVWDALARGEFITEAAESVGAG